MTAYPEEEENTTRSLQSTEAHLQKLQWQCIAVDFQLVDLLFSSSAHSIVRREKAVEKPYKVHPVQYERDRGHKALPRHSRLFNQVTSSLTGLLHEKQR